jgi:hypothetical protein
MKHSATIISSRRVVDIEIEEFVFYVLRPLVASDHCQAPHSYPVAGPFPLDDQRFIIQEVS